MNKRWYTELIIGEVYFIVGYVDRNLTTPSIGTFIYLGIGVLDTESDGKYCFQDAYSFLAEPEENVQPSSLTLSEDALDMVADKLGLVAWLQSEAVPRT